MANLWRAGIENGVRRMGSRLFASVRTKILASFLLLLVLSTIGSIVFTRQILLLRLDREIDRELTQEVQEFRKLLNGNDPRTGRPFGDDLTAIVDVYFSRNVPGEGEATLALVGSRPHRSARSHDAPYRLEELPEAVDRWAALTHPTRGELNSPKGEIRYLAVPVVLEGETKGTFVVGNFPAFERAEINDLVRVETGVTIAVVIAAALIGWFIAGRVLSPLKALANTTSTITETDLSRRISVRGHDEVSRLGERFNEMLDRLEMAFGTQRQFVDDAGHELRTPITIISGHLELLGEDPDERRETVELVMDELDRMTRIVDDLLVLAKAEQPDFLNLDLVDIAALTSDLHAKASALAKRAWRVESTDNGLVVADRQRLTQAVMQLAQNATQHTSVGDVIALGSTLDHNEAHIWVRDTGPGIPPEEQDRVFERFARGTSGRSRSEGAGLGLSIVQAIAQAHHGRVELRSRPGEGAIFTIVIPTDIARSTAIDRESALS